MKNRRIIFCTLCLIIGMNVFCQTYDSVDYEELFSQDIDRIEKLSVEMQDKNPSTVGMHRAIQKLEQGYDELLNKYYQILLSTIEKEEDKKEVRESQRNWIKFRDSEKKVVRALVAQEYKKAGGGTIWSIVSSNTVADITKRRVVEIVNLLTLGELN